MRKKIGKRIGPVPITLVAVLALAAFISAGLLFTLNSNVTQAQGLQPLEDNDSATKCEVTVANDDDSENTASTVDVVTSGVQDGGCNVSGTEATVTFVNNDPDKAYVAIYVTGGEDFSEMQAAKDDGSALGAEGVDEYLLEIDGSTSGAGGIESPGKASITVSRDMAKSGNVYVFAYVTDATSKTFNDGTVDNEYSDAGVPFSVLVDDGTSAGLLEFDAMALGNAAKAAVAAVRAIDDPSDGPAMDVFESGERPAELSVLNADIENAVGSSYAGSIHNAMTVALPADGTTWADRIDTIEEKLNTHSENADIADNNPADGGLLKLLNDYIDEMDDAILVDTNLNDAGTIVVGATDADMIAEDADDEDKAAFKLSIAQAMAAIEAVDATLAAVGDRIPQSFPNYTADVAVLVKFQDPAVAKVDDATISKVTPGRVSASGVSVVALAINDKNKVGLNGFATLTIDPASDADIVFTESNLKTHRVEVVGGTIKPGETATIEGLPTRGPVRVKITADYNSGELVLEGYAMREGNPSVVTIMTYACVESTAEGRVSRDICYEETLASEADETKFMIATSKLTESTIVGPGEDFLVVSTVTDSAGNKLADAVSTKEKRVAGVTSDTLTFGSPEMLKKESRTVGTVDDEGDAGSYEIEVASGSAKMTVSVIVSDVASIIMVSCVPEMISTDSGLTDCMVTVTDAMGNIPSNLGEAKNSKGELIDDTVRVAVRSTDVNIIGVDINNDAKLDADGMATFSVLLREDAPEGSITINVSSTIGDETLRANTTVMYGEAAPEPMPMPMLLGAPSITSVMSDAAGMATVMLTPGDNASKHWVWAAPTDGSTGMWHGDSALAGDADMVTFSALTSGMNYWFIAVAGRGEGDASEWSAWSSWTAETPIQ